MSTMKTFRQRSVAIAVGALFAGGAYAAGPLGIYSTAIDRNFPGVGQTTLTISGANFCAGPTVILGTALPDTVIASSGLITATFSTALPDDTYTLRVSCSLLAGQTVFSDVAAPFIGAQGATGAQGAQGANGTNGTNGAQGAQGANGTNGAQGAQGANGTNGTNGAQGAQGADGTNGAQGAQGANGTNGAQGAQGADGTDGTDGNTVLNGTVTPVAEGVDGDFYIDTVAQLIYGPKTGGSWGSGTSLVGAQGAQGANGSNGAQGAQGANGTDGTNGAQGAQGANGTNGAQGAQGANGANGAQGAQGANGANGAQGAQGANGANGAQGAQGANGTNGAQGAQGATGAGGLVSGGVKDIKRAATRYMGLWFNGLPSGAISSISAPTAEAVEADAQEAVLIAGTVTALKIQLGANAGAAGTSYTFTVRRNGVDTGVACTITGATSTCAGTGSAAFAAGDLFSISAVPSATQPTDNLEAQWTIRY